jgi:hypothetical protein
MGTWKEPEKAGGAAQPPMLVSPGPQHSPRLGGYSGPLARLSTCSHRAGKGVHPGAEEKLGATDSLYLATGNKQGV